MTKKKDQAVGASKPDKIEEPFILMRQPAPGPTVQGLPAGPDAEGHERLQHLTDREAAAGIPYEKPRRTPPTPGPQAGSNESPAAIVANRATEEELEILAAAIKKREGTTSWAYFRCDHCGQTIKLHPADRNGTPTAGQPCGYCQVWGQPRADRGHLRQLGPDEELGHLAREKARAREQEDRLRKAAFNETNSARGKEGLAPLTWDAFLAEQKRAYQAMLERGQKLEAVAALYRKAPK